jgi:hypothetical protein
MILLLISCTSSEMAPYTAFEPFDSHAVLVYGSGVPNTGLVFCRDFLIQFAIPEFLVYENGLVLFSCPGEAWPEICQNNVSPERVSDLLNELSVVGFFSKHRSYPGIPGPHSAQLILAHTAEADSEMLWHTDAFVPDGHPEPLLSVLEIIEDFNEEAQVDKQLYRPRNVAIWMWRPCECTSRSNTQAGEMCSHCDDLDAIPEWPFEFELPYAKLRSYDCKRHWEFPQPFSTIASAISNLEEHSLGPPEAESIFRDGDTLISVWIRPYLPGETIQAGCSEDHWDKAGEWPTYDTLPFYSKKPG